jgi:hypothetical protein
VGVALVAAAEAGSGVARAEVLGEVLLDVSPITKEARNRSSSVVFVGREGDATRRVESSDCDLEGGLRGLEGPSKLLLG